MTAVNLTQYRIIARADYRGDPSFALDDVLADILAGQVEGVIKIDAYNTHMNSAWDATREVMMLISRRLPLGAEIHRELRDMIEHHLGFAHARGLRVLEDAA